MNFLGRLLCWCRRRPKSLGERGEDEAARYLRRKKYKILGRRVPVARGDLDLVALDGKTVVFVEVKTRTSPEAGGPESAVHEKKQRQLHRLALLFLRQHGLQDRPARFDVVAIVWPAGHKSPQIVHFVNAFDAPGELD